MSRNQRRAARDIDTRGTHSQVTLSDTVPEGRGLVATSDIAAQEPLLKARSRAHRPVIAHRPSHTHPEGRAPSLLRNHICPPDDTGPLHPTQVPASLLLTAERAAADCHPALSGVRGLPEWSALALFLASHRARVDGAGKAGAGGAGRTSAAFDFWVRAALTLARLLGRLVKSDASCVACTCASVFGQLMCHFTLSTCFSCSTAQ